MRRDHIDFHEVRPIHAEIHERLLNWARWCRGGSGGSTVQPMFRHYRDGYPEAPQTIMPVDSLDGHRVEKLVVALPAKHRTVLQWWYCRPYIPVMKVRRVLGLTTPGLYDLVHEARAMVRNRT